MKSVLPVGTRVRYSLFFIAFFFALASAPLLVYASDSDTNTNANTADLRAQWISAISSDNTTTLKDILAQASDDSSLWDITASNGKSALMVASKMGDEGFAKQLVAQGANIKAKTQTHGTAFMFAVLGDQQLIAAWLKEQGADINARGSNGWTSVMIASATGLDDTLDWLLVQGANANTPDVYGFSPLMRAADNAHEKSVALLLASDDADVHWQDELDNSALHYAVSGAVSASGAASTVYVNIIQQLLQADASATLKNRSDLSPIDIAKASLNDQGIAYEQRPKQRQQRNRIIELLEASASLDNKD